MTRMTMTQDQAVEQAEKVRVYVGNALAAIPDLDIDVEEPFRFTVNDFGAPMMMDAFWEDEPRPEGYGPDRRYYVIAAVVTYLDASRPLGDGYVEVTWVDESAGLDTPARTVLPMTFVPAADLGDGEPLARLAVEALLADRATARD
jgi:hypothetical protein